MCVRFKNFVSLKNGVVVRFLFLVLGVYGVISQEFVHERLIIFVFFSHFNSITVLLLL